MSVFLGIPGCSYIVGVNTGTWAGWDKPCGWDDGVRRDPRQERYDIVLCRRHLPIVEAELLKQLMIGGN